jgi:hypothetical protein
MKKIQSLTYLWSQAKASLLRFSLAIFSALLASSIGIYLVEQGNDIDNTFPFVNAMLSAALGIPLFFCIAVFSEKRNTSLPYRWAFQLLGLVALILLYFTLPNRDSTLNNFLPYSRYIVYNITVHLLVAFAPYFNKGELNGFWQFNKLLFVRFCTAVLYSGFLYIGLALAFLALDSLFDVSIEDKTYFQLFIFILGWFNTWFFVSGLPAELDGLEEIKTYPKGLKIFTQYVLLPLLLLYFLILYGYATKIILSGIWPEGIVSNLILCVSILGILTVLLMHPYGQQQENKWIQRFERLYYVLLLPLIILLFIAIGIRLGDYGFTINRYIVLFLGIWVALVSIYFIVGGKNIKLVPVSLAITVLTCSFGPWSMFAISEQGQVNRLQEILENNAILVNEKIVNEVIWGDTLASCCYKSAESLNESKLNDSLHREVSSIVRYLHNHHGFKLLRPWFTQHIDSILIANNQRKKSRWNHFTQPEYYMRSMGLSYGYRVRAVEEEIEGGSYFSYRCDKDQLIPLEQYDYLIELSEITHHAKTYVDNELSFRFPNSSAYPTAILFIKNKKDTVRLNLNPMLVDLIRNYGKKRSQEVDPDYLTLRDTSAKMALKLKLHYLRLNDSNDTLSIHDFDSRLWIKLLD